MSEPSAANGALAELEQRCDSLLGRSIARISGELIRRGGARDPLVGREARYLEWSNDDPATQLIEKLKQALDDGALETAEQIGRLLLRQLDAGAALDDYSIALLADILLLVGDRDRAARLIDTHPLALGATDRGAGALEALGRSMANVWLPSGRPNAFKLSRRIAQGTLTAGELALSMRPLGRRVHTLPELCLLFFNACRGSDGSGAIRFLNRYLRAMGLTACQPLSISAPQSGLLNALRFEKVARQRGPLVSVLVTARNAERTLSYAIDSLLSQSYECVEILVADDASEDGTLALCRARYRQNERVRIFSSHQQQGAYNLKNALARMATGSLITFHDADDLALPQRIALQVEAIIGGTQRVACIGNGLRLRLNGEIVFFKDQRASRLSRVSLMLERHAFDELGGFRSARIGADHEFYLKFLHRYGYPAVRRLKIPLMLCAWGSGSATRTRGSESLEDGYRAPARRLYSELVYARYIAETLEINDTKIERCLRDSGNYMQPVELEELS